MVTCCVSAFAFAHSRFYTTFVNVHRVSVGSHRGALVFGLFDDAEEASINWGRRQPDDPGTIWIPKSGHGPDLRTWYIPLWIPFLLSIAVVIVTRRRPLWGHCRKCGYNLTGNESGRCPECGQPYSSAS